MLNTRLSFLAIILAAGILAPPVLAGQPPAIYSVSEGTDPLSHAPTLTITGKKLNKFVTFDLFDGGTSTFAGLVEVVSKSSPLLILRLPAALKPGAYTLDLAEKGGNTVSLDVSVGNGMVLPGSVGSTALSPELRADLNDAATLGGTSSSFYTNAGNVDAGTLGTDFFSAHADLVAEGRVGKGATQVAAGDHDHEGVYSPVGHGHSNTWDGIIAAKVYMSANKAISGDTDTILAFDSEEFDTDGCHSTTSDTDRLTCQTAGYYIVGFKFYAITSGPVVPTKVDILKNGSIASAGRANVPQTPFGDSPVLTTVLYLDQGDYLQVVAYPSYAGIVLTGGKGYTEFSMVRIGPAPPE